MRVDADGKGRQIGICWPGPLRRALGWTVHQDFLVLDPGISVSLDRTAIHDLVVHGYIIYDGNLQCRRKNMFDKHAVGDGAHGGSATFASDDHDKSAKIPAISRMCETHVGAGWLLE
jgi:hypothetical protein